MNKALLATVAALLGATAAHGTEVLSFGQSGAGTSPITGTESGGITTIMATDAPVSVTSCLLCSTIIGPETLTLNVHSVGPAFMFHGFVVQNFSGTFQIMSGSGQDVLSGTFNDATFGAGTSLTLSASNAMVGEMLSLNSTVMPTSELGSPKAMSLSLADVTPLVGVTDGSLSSFTGSVAGTFSASPVSVPEPSTLPLLMLGLGVAGVYTLARRRRRK